MERKIRVSHILDDKSTINESTPNGTMYVDENGLLNVKRGNNDWNIQKSVQEKFQSEFKENQGYTKEKHIYGFCIDMTESNPDTAMTYTDDAIGMDTPISSNGFRDLFDLGSWSSFIKDFIGCKPVAVYQDGLIYRELQYNDFSKDIYGNTIGINYNDSHDEDGKEYNLMMQFKALWYTMYISEHKFYFKVANYKVNDDYINDAFLYNGEMMDYMCISIFTLTPNPDPTKIEYKSVFSDIRDMEWEAENGAENLTVEQIREAMTRNITNASTMGYAQFIYIYMLLYMVTKTTNMRNVFDPENEGLNYNNGGFRFKRKINRNLCNPLQKGLFSYDIAANDFDSELSQASIEEKVFGMENFLSGMSIDGFGLDLNNNSYYYETAPYTMNLPNTTGKANIIGKIDKDEPYIEVLVPIKEYKSLNGKVLVPNYNYKANVFEDAELNLGYYMCAVLGLNGGLSRDGYMFEIYHHYITSLSLEMWETMIYESAHHNNSTSKFKFKLVQFRKIRR